MDIQKERLRINCPICGNKIILTFNSVSCPVCSSAFSEEEVHKVFYQYESQIANSKLANFGSNLEKVGNGMQKTGSSIQQIGCFIFMLPFGLFCLYMLIKIISM